MDDHENNAANKILIFAGVTFVAFWVWLIILGGVSHLIDTIFPLKLFIGCSFGTGILGTKYYDKFFNKNV